MSCRKRDSVEGEADFDRSGVEKLLGCFLGKELLGDLNGSDDADTSLSCLVPDCCALIPLSAQLLPIRSTGVGG